jgi:hypothetical protein
VRILVLPPLLSALVACQGSTPDASRPERLVEPPRLEPKGPVILDPHAPGVDPGELSPPPDPAAATGVRRGDQKVEVHWDTKWAIQAVVSDATRIYASRVAIPGGERGQIVALELGARKPTVLVDDLGRPDELALAGEELYWLDRPGRPEDPPAGIMAVPRAGGTPRRVASDPRIEHGLTVTDSMVFWVLRVEDQGRIGGLAGAPRSGGEPRDFFRDEGPVFHARAAGSELWFMAHVGSGPDVIWSAREDGTQLREHHRTPRGIVAMHVDATDVLWVQATFDPLVSHVMRMPRAGGPTATLWRLEGKLLDQIASDPERIWVAVSAVEDLGEVLWIPRAGGDATRVAESRHVWRLLATPAEVRWWDTWYDQRKHHRVRSLAG